MSTTKGIERRYEDEVKKAATRLANDILADPRGFWDLDKHAREFKCWVKSAQVRREERLAKLQTVKVERRHLQAVAKWLRDAVRGYKHTNKAASEVLGREPICFGQWNPSKHCNQSDYWKDGLCPACQAISPLIEEG